MVFVRIHTNEFIQFCVVFVQICTILYELDLDLDLDFIITLPLGLSAFW